MIPRLNQLPWSRSFASHVDPHGDAVEKINASLDNHLRETRSIESSLHKELASSIPQIDDDTHASLSDDAKGVVKDHQTYRHLKEQTQNSGAKVLPHYQPHHLLIYPPHPSEITLPLLLASQTHLGHATSLWNPANSKYIFGIRQGVHIIALDITAAHLRRACRVVSGIAERGGLVLFVGTRTGQDRCVVQAARRSGGCHLFDKWQPGTITNGHQILGKCKMKVVDEFDRELPNLEDNLKDRPCLKPDLVVCLNPLENWVMLHECALNGIPTMGIIDTDANPTWVTYPIPANDDSMRSVQLIAGVLGRAGQEGRVQRMAKAMRKEYTYEGEKVGSDRERSARASS